MERNEYRLTLMFNGRLFYRVQIDQHYRENHPEMSDELILELVKMLDGDVAYFEKENENFYYFKVEPLEHQYRPYRLVFLTHKRDNYLGVINAFRVGRKK